MDLGASARWRPRTGFGRLRATSWSILQCAVGGAIAWVFATEVLGHDEPFFAAVAAIVCLGMSSSQRLRRVGELAVGVTLGVGIADLIVSWIGSGAWQIAVVVILAMSAAQVLDGGGLVTMQAGLQAVFVTVLPQPPGGNLVRWEDALVGGATALVVAAVAPADPGRQVWWHGRMLVTELADVVAEGAAALRTGNAARAASALERARATQSDIDTWRGAIQAGEEISRLSPLRWHRRPDLARARAALVGIDDAVRGMRVALRHVTAVLERGESLPSPVAGMLEDFAAILRALRHDLGGPPELATSRGALAAFAPRLDRNVLCAKSLSATVVVAQVRSAVVDLLGIHGMDVDEARALLPR